MSDGDDDTRDRFEQHSATVRQSALPDVLDYLGIRARNRDGQRAACAEAKEQGLLVDREVELLRSAGLLD